MDGCEMKASLMVQNLQEEHHRARTRPLSGGCLGVPLENGEFSCLWSWLGAFVKGHNVAFQGNIKRSKYETIAFWGFVYFNHLGFFNGENGNCVSQGWSECDEYVRSPPTGQRWDYRWNLHWLTPWNVSKCQSDKDGGVKEVLSDCWCYLTFSTARGHENRWLAFWTVLCESCWQWGNMKQQISRLVRKVFRGRESFLWIHQRSQW